jgi:hypothetical protein
LQLSHLPLLFDAFPDPECYLSPTAASDATAQATQFNVINPSSGNKIDFLVAGPTSWVLTQINRSKSVPVFPDVDLNVAAPEDVILGKLI